MHVLSIFIGYTCSHWHLMHCFGEEGTQEGPPDMEGQLVD